MAAKAQKNKPNAGKKAEFIGFVNIDVPSDRKDDVRAFMRQDEEIALLIEQAVASGYKISFAFNKANQSVIGSMQSMEEGEYNAGFVMSAHAKHWYDALAVLMWKHFILLEQKWDKPEPDADMAFG